jgi:hypothetical protein
VSFVLRDELALWTSPRTIIGIVPTLDAQIDELYKKPLSEFVSARGSLAKTLKGDEAKQVKALVKPTLVPWAVNQMYWQARPVYHGLAKAGEKLRAAQIAALKGRGNDLKEVSVAHRKAISEAVATATQLAGAHGQYPAADVLGRMLEALSLTDTPPERPGRFTQVLQPAGFEALAGIPLKAGGASKASPPAVEKKLSEKQRVAAERERAVAERERAAAERKQEAAIRQAEGAVVRAKDEEDQARREWDRTRKQREKAERALAELRDFQV